MISAIVAVNNAWGIGYQGELLEAIPEDLKYFKSTTNNGIVVMGKKTWESLPKKPLPNRLNVVIDFVKGTDYIDGVVYCNLEDAIGMMEFSNEKAKALGQDSEWFVIGGGSIYKQLLPYCDQVYVTKIYKDHENIDAYFPNLDEMEEWNSSPVSELRTHNDISYQFWLYSKNS
jgi:dihydrofolate reductase